MKIEIDIEFFDEMEAKEPTKEQLKEWVEFTLGITNQMKPNNPMDELDLSHEDIEVSVIIKDF